MVDLVGRTSLVTGATAGIGRAVAELLAKRGADVVEHGCDPERGAETAGAISGNGGTARFDSADLIERGDGVVVNISSGGATHYWASARGSTHERG